MITTGRSSPFDAAARTTTPTRRATPRRRRRAASDERRRRPRPSPPVVVVAAVDRAARPRAGDALAIVVVVVVVVVVAATLIVSIARRVPRRGEMLCRRAARAATLPTEAEARDERGWRVSVITRSSSVVLSARALALKIKTWHPPSSPHRPSRGDAALLDGRHARAGVLGLRLRGRLRRRRLGRGGRGPPRRGPRRRGERI